MWRRPKEAPVRRVDQMEHSPIARDRARLSKTIAKTIKKVLEVNGLSIDMIYDWTLCHPWIRVADPT